MHCGFVAFVPERLMARVAVRNDEWLAIDEATDAKGAGTRLGFGGWYSLIMWCLIRTSAKFLSRSNGEPVPSAAMYLAMVVSLTASRRVLRQSARKVLRPVGFWAVERRDSSSDSLSAVLPGKRKRTGWRWADGIGRDEFQIINDNAAHN